MKEIVNARIIQYQFEVLIRQKATDIWPLMTNKINSWWPTDFRALGEGSTMSLEAKAGGQLIEFTADNASLEWYRVQMVLPGNTLYLTGYMAPDWGGPTTSMLKLTVEDRDSGAALIVTDALLGNVTEESASEAEGGWKTVFGDSFR